MQISPVTSLSLKAGLAHAYVMQTYEGNRLQLFLTLKVINDMSEESSEEGDGVLSNIAAKQRRLRRLHVLVFRDMRQPSLVHAAAVKR